MEVSFSNTELGAAIAITGKAGKSLSQEDFDIAAGYLQEIEALFDRIGSDPRFCTHLEICYGTGINPRMIQKELSGE